MGDEGIFAPFCDIFGIICIFLFIYLICYKIALTEIYHCLFYSVSKFLSTLIIVFSNVNNFKERVQYIKRQKIECERHNIFPIEISVQRQQRKETQQFHGRNKQMLVDETAFNTQHLPRLCLFVQVGIGFVREPLNVCLDRNVMGYRRYEQKYNNQIGRIGRDQFRRKIPQRNIYRNN